MLISDATYDYDWTSYSFRSNGFCQQVIAVMRKVVVIIIVIITLTRMMLMMMMMIDVVDADDADVADDADDADDADAGNDEALLLRI